MANSVSENWNCILKPARGDRYGLNRRWSFGHIRFLSKCSQRHHWIVVPLMLCEVLISSAVVFPKTSIIKLRVLIRGEISPQMMVQADLCSEWFPNSAVLHSLYFRFLPVWDYGRWKQKPLTYPTALRSLRCQRDELQFFRIWTLFFPDGFVSRCVTVWVFYS